LQTLNPYTDVDQLIFKLNDRSDKIECRPTGSDISLNNWTINAKLIHGNIVVRLSHTKPQSVALNVLFPLPTFFTTDDNLNDTPCTFISSVFVVNRRTIIYIFDKTHIKLNYHYQMVWMRFIDTLAQYDKIDAATI